MPKKTKKMPVKKVTTKKTTPKKVTTKKTTTKKVTKPKVPAVVAPTMPPAIAAPNISPQALQQLLTPQKSEADKIWEEIKDRPIEMFALPNQFVFNHCVPVPVEPSKLYLTIRSTATLPSLEVAVGAAYVVELADKFVIVSRRPVLPNSKK